MTARTMRGARRRALRIVGAAAGLPLLVTPAARILAGREAPPLRRWRGAALGAEAEILLAHPDPVRAHRLVAASMAEVRRLERVFSLFDPESELSQLNRHGRLAAPSHDLLLVLAESRRIGEVTGGAFDVSVQPLWQLYARHFAAGATSAPDPRAVAKARSLVDFRGIEAGSAHTAFAHPGMAVTLNGIAQGYITDRVADILRNAGIDDVLVEMGETRALGRHPSGRPWTVGLADPRQPDRSLRRCALADAALASSGGYGTRFDAAGRYHHIFDPATGDSARHVSAASVRAPRATVADALATALAVLPPEQAAGVLTAGGGTNATLILADGSVKVIGRLGETREI